MYKLVKSIFQEKKCKFCYIGTKMIFVRIKTFTVLELDKCLQELN